MRPHDLLDILACPACRGDVSFIEGGNALLCPRCGLSYPIREGIPVMLANEAEKIEKAGTGGIKG
jgi:uncharacterized protein YbaR (Trm112 family)